MTNPVNMLVLLGCLIGYLAADILISTGRTTGSAASVVSSILPSAFGLAVGLIAKRLNK